MPGIVASTSTVGKPSRTLLSSLGGMTTSTWAGVPARGAAGHMQACATSPAAEPRQSVSSGSASESANAPISVTQKARRGNPMRHTGAAVS